MASRQPKPVPTRSGRPRAVLPAAACALLLGLSLPAHSDYDFNAANAVVVQASAPTMDGHDYQAEYRAREDAREHERAEEQREQEAQQLMYDQQQREREQQSTPSHASSDMTLGMASPQAASIGSVSHPSPAPSASSREHTLQAWISDYREGILLALFILGMAYWLLHDARTPQLTAQPAARQGHAPRQANITPSTSVSAAAPAVPRPVPPTQADQPIDFHPVLNSGSASHPVNALAEQMLDAFAAHQSGDPLIYRAQLQKALLDYSADSLARVDHFLRPLRAKTPVDFQRYSTLPEYRNLLILLGFYLGSTIARLTGLEINWYDHSTAKTMLNKPELPDSIQTLYSCMIGERYYLLPLDVVCNMLFAPTPSESCSAKLAFYQAQMTDSNMHAAQTG